MLLSDSSGERMVTYTSMRAEALGRIGGAKPESVNVTGTIDALVRLLSDKDPDVRVSAAEALGTIGVATPEVVDEEMADGFARLLADENKDIREKAARILEKLTTANPAMLTARSG